MAGRKKFSYKSAAAELDGIVSELESEDVDVDALAEKVKRAVQLIRACKEKLRSTEGEVRSALAGLEGLPGQEEKDEDGPAGDSDLFA